MSAPASEKVDLSKYIEMRDGRPNIRGRRLPVSFVAKDYAEKQRSLSEIAWSYTISEEQVVAAILFYLEHREEVDTQDTQLEQEFDELYERFGGSMPGHS